MSLGGLAGGGVVGSARVLVVPDAAGFDAALKRQIEQSVGRQGVTVPIGGDTRQADAAVASVTTRARRSRTSLSIDADTGPAEAKLKSLNARAGDIFAGLRGLSPLGGGIFFRSSAALDTELDKTTRMAGVLLGVAAAAKVTINASSALAESQSKANEIFGEGTPIVERFADTAAERIGLSEQAALEATGSFGQLFVNIGLGERPAAEMSKRMTQLAGDLASFNNIRPEDALLKLRSGLVGEIEPLRVLGVNFTEAEVKSKAFALGIASAGEELSVSEKLQARYALILEQTSKAQGDAERTGEGFANSQRRATALLTDFAAGIGEGITPAAAEGLQAIGAFVGGINSLADRVGGLGRVVSEVVKSTFGFLRFKGITDAIFGGDDGEKKADVQRDKINQVNRAVQDLEPFIRALGGSTEGTTEEQTAMVEEATKLKEKLDELGGAVGVNGATLLFWANGSAKEAEQAARNIASAMDRASQAFLGDFSVTAEFSGTNIARDAEQAEAANQRLAESQRTLAEARQRYGDAQRDAAERALDAEVRLSDAQEQAAESVLDAEQRLADSHTQLAELRESQAIDARREQEDYAEKVEDVNRRILDSEENLAEQRVSLNEAVRDAEERLQDTREAGSRRVRDAEQRLADLLQRRSAGGNPEMEREIAAQQELRNARQNVEDARREAAENEQRDIESVEKARRRETEGIRDAEEQITEARKAGLDLVREAEQITRNQVARQREMEKAVADVGEAEKALNEARRDGARSVAEAEKGIAEAREEGTRAIAKAAEAVAEAQRKVGDAAAEVNSEIRLTTRLLEGSSAAADLNAFIWSKFGAVVDPLTDARMALRALLEEAGNLSPVQKKIVDFYQDSLIAGKVFSDNIREAIRQGYDPGLIAQLLEEGPKEAGPLLQEMINDHSGRLREFVNASEEALRNLNAINIEQARLTNIAINAQNDQTAADLQLAYGIMQAQAAEGGRLTMDQLVEKLGARREDVARTVQEYGVTIADGLNPVLASIGADLIDRAHIISGGLFAEGGKLPRDSGFRNSGTVVQWAEPETGGEYHAFIPKANDHRRKNALDTLAMAAGDLDHAIIPRSVLDGMNGFFAPEFQAFALGGKTAGLNPDFLHRLERWSETVPGGFLNITSGKRSREEQAELYRRYQAGTGNLAAPPGHSKHELGLAADHSPNGWALARTADPFGIIHPVPSESWHAEPSGQVAGGTPVVIAHTELPPVPDMNWAGWGFGGTAGQAMGYERRLAQDFINAKEEEMRRAAEAAGAGAAGPAAVGGDIDAWIREAIRITGAPASWFDGIRTRAMQESGGRNIPQQVNDVNMRRGTPAFGPMQVIEPTFRAYAEPGYEDWHNPVHNIAAAINYIESRYGDPYHLPRGGYAQGGILSFAGGGTVPGSLGAPQLAVVHGGEVISDPTVSRTRVEASTTVNLTLNVPVSISGASSGASVAQEIEDAILRSNLLDRAAEKINRAMLNQRRKVGGAT